MVHVTETYRNGLAYVRVGSIEDAEAMLAAGDAGFDVADKGAVKFERSQETLRVARDPERASSRDDLVSAIRADKSGDSP